MKIIYIISFAALLFVILQSNQWSVLLEGNAFKPMLFKVLKSNYRI